MANTRYRFRDLVLDPAARELTRDGEQVALPGRSLDCLIHLISHRERAVGRDELISAVWGRTEVTDSLLAQTILRLRRSLGDSGSEGAIRTVARFGYRWVEDTVVETEEPDGAVAAVAAVDAARTGASADAPPAQRVALGPVADAGADAGTDADPDDGMAAMPPPAATSTAAAAPAGAPVDGMTTTPVSRPGRRWLLAALVVLTLAWIIGGQIWMRGSHDPAPGSADMPAAGNAGGQDDAHSSARQPAVLVLPVQVTGTATDQDEWAWLRLGLMDMIGSRLRAGGMPAMPSENVLAVLVQPGASMAALAERFGSLVIEPAIGQEHGRWRASLATSSGLATEATADDPVVAAVAAADLLLIRLGRQIPVATGLAPIAPEQLVLRLRAAILAEQFDTARQLIAQAPEALRHLPEVQLEHARLDQGQGKYPAAEQRLAELLAQLPAEASPELRGRILAGLGGIRFRRLDLDNAAEAFAEAIELLEGSAEHAGLAQAFVGRAAIASRNEDLNAATADLGRARIEMEAGGDLVGMAQIDMNLALIQIKRYRPASSQPLLREAEHRFVAMGAREQLAYVRYLSVGVQLQLLELERAAATMASLWPPEQHTGNERLRWQLALTRSFVLAATGRLSAAEAELARILAGASPPDDAAVVIGARTMQAQVANIRAVSVATVDGLQAVLTDDLRRLRPDLYVAVWAAYQRSLRRIGRVGEARWQTDAFAAWVQANPNPWRQVHRALALAEQAWHEQPDGQALALFAQAFHLAQQLAVPEDLVHVAEPYGMALLERGDIDKAAAVIGTIAAWADQDLRAAWAQAQLFRAQGRDEAWQRALERVQALRGERPLPGSD
ncbi:MAG: transcriptional regulator [Xanthomonadales bacterium]|nr:transcriptional regulator [Xanthomonadales bacterium]